MSIHACIFEDPKHSNFLPLTLSRPVFDLRIGCGTLRSRLLDGLAGAKPSIICREYLADLARAATPRIPVSELPSSATLFLNGRWLALGDERERVLAVVGDNTIAVKGGDIVAARLPAAAARDFSTYLIERVSAAAIGEMCDALRARTIGSDDVEQKLPDAIEQMIERHGLRRVVIDDARLVSFPWQLIEFNSDVIVDDFARTPFRGTAEDSVVYAGAYLVDPERVVIGEKSVVRAGAVLDASDGPIVIADHVLIMPNAVLVGPCFVGSHSVVNASARILSGTSIGAVCKVGGEISETIFAAYSNKQHDGFLGNSYVGEWVNIGAATNNSDLKNNYSAVRMWCAGSERETGRQFLGLLMGDHTKTGINVLFNTGTVVGFNCNVYASELPAKFVSSFSWGHGADMTRYDLERALETAAIVMARRDVRFTPAHRALFQSIFDLGERAGWNL